MRQYFPGSETEMKMMRMTGSQMIIFEMVSMVLCLLFFINHVRERNKLIMECRNEASGEIVEIKAIATQKEDIYRYQPIVSFDTGSGTVQGPDAWDMKKGDFSKGDHVTVRYNPDKPSVFYVVENHRSDSLAGVYLIILILFPVMMMLTYLIDK